MNSNEIPLVLPLSGSGREEGNKDERSGFNFNRKLIFASAGLITGAAMGYLGHRSYKDFQEVYKQIENYRQIEDVDLFDYPNSPETMWKKPTGTFTFDDPTPPSSPSGSESSFNIHDLPYFN